MNYTNNIYNYFIICGGKCGTSTLHHTFIKNNLNGIYGHSICYFGSFDKKISFKCHLNNCETHKTKNEIDFTILDLFKNINSTEQIWILDVYRNPLERQISAFFQEIETYMTDYKNININEIINFFLEWSSKYNYKNELYNPLNQILSLFSLKKDKEFDFKKKYYILKHKNFNFIKIRFCDIDNWDKILSDIFNKKITIYNDNETKNKNYYQLYKEFNKNIKIPKNHFEKIIKNDEDFKFFNSEQEIENYYLKWNNKLF